MPTQAFIQKKKTGRYFEGLMRPVLAQMGMQVIDSESERYSVKKGYDCLVKINGGSAKIEFKYDAMSEQTGNVCLELEALSHSTSDILVYGLPEGDNINVFTMWLRDALSYALQWPTKALVGEFRLPAALVPKETFIGQEFVHRFKRINLN
jgi:hypothetical protein